MEMNNLRRAYGVTRWEGESNESIYEMHSMVSCENGVKCGVVEWMKKNT